MKHIIIAALISLSACAIEPESGRNHRPFEPAAVAELAPERPPHPLCECPDFECRERWLCDTVRAPVCVIVDCGDYVLEDCTQCEGLLLDRMRDQVAR